MHMVCPMSRCKIYHTSKHPGLSNFKVEAFHGPLSEKVGVGSRETARKPT